MKRHLNTLVDFDVKYNFAQILCIDIIKWYLEVFSSSFSFCSFSSMYSLHAITSSSMSYCAIASFASDNESVSSVVTAATFCGFIFVLAVANGACVFALLLKSSA